MNRRWNLVFFVGGSIALVYLIVQHQAHLVVLLPYLFLLACPLMHLFMHGGHGHSGHHGPQDEGNSSGTAGKSS